ncbi:MAG: hypothetical protein WC757_02170 [Candidatus Paceibacterota bacterium]|jgi:hypothetical protein
MTSLKCKKCGFQGAFTAKDTDRFCRQCGNAFFVPIDKINGDIDWVDAYNSLYNLNILLSPAIQYAISRYCNWRYGITTTGRILRGPDGAEKINRYTVLHQSFVRSGYALRVMEEKFSGKTTSFEESVLVEFERSGETKFSKLDSNIFDSVWDLYIEGESSDWKDYAKKIISISSILGNNYQDYFLLPKDKLQIYFGSLILDLTKMLQKEGFALSGGEREGSDDDVIFDLIFGYSIRIAERSIL